MRRKYNEFYIGVAVSLTIIMIVASILYLEKSDFIQQGIEVNLVVQNAGGIRKGGDVLFEGVNVGSVRSMQLTSGGVLLRLRITKVDSIPDDSRFAVAATSLLGSKSVEITPGKSTTYLKNGAYVHGATSTGLSELLRSGNKITDNIGEVARNVSALTDRETRLKVRSALSNIDQSVGLIHNSLKGNLDDIHEAIASLKGISTDNRAPIDSIVNRLAQHSKELGVAIKNTETITQNLRQIIQRLNEGRGTAGKILTDDELYNRLDSTLTSLNSLIKDIRDHPGRYIHISVF